MAPTARSIALPFRFDPRYRIAAAAFGVHPGNASVRLDADGLDARFGAWHVRTPLANIAGIGVSGPYSVLKTIGPAHLSFADRGLTFATNPTLGVCISFREPVPGIDPFGALRHPGLTVTVEDPEALVEVAVALGVDRTDGAQLRIVQEAEDDLHTMSARELRALAAERGIGHPSSLSKAELVRLLEPQLDADLIEQLTTNDR